MKQIVFKNQQDEIVQTVQGDDLDEWLKRAKQSPAWNNNLVYTFEDLPESEVTLEE